MGLFDTISAVTGGGSKGITLKGTAVVEKSFLEEGGKWAMYGGPINEAIRRMYSIALWDFETQSVLEIPPTFDPREEFKQAEFYFSVPPRVLEVGEPYATTIVPTQDSAKYVESHGVVLRDIRVQGTTGLRPNIGISFFLDLLNQVPLIGAIPGATTVANQVAGPIVNRAAGAVSDVRSLVDSSYKVRGIPDDERTGHDDVMFLRNIFRHYSDLKKDNNKASSVVMVWRNTKDGDYWIVEPKDFKLNQDSKNPMLYNYTFQLTTLVRFEQTISIPKDDLQAVRDDARALARIQSATRRLADTLLVVSTSLDRIAGIGIFAQNLFMRPAIRAVKNTTAVFNSFNNIPVSVSQNWKNSRDGLDAAVKQWEEAIAADPEGKRTEKQDPVLNALKKGLRAADRVLVEPLIAQSLRSVFEERQGRIANVYREPTVAGSKFNSHPLVGGSKSFLGNEVLGGAVSRAPVQPGDTIQTLAKRLLGDRTRWQVLATLNDLRAPYVSSAGGDKVLKPGEYILYPVRDNTGVSTVELNPNSVEKNERWQKLDTAIERAYGRDLRLKSDFLNRTDIAINEYGDLSTITGIPNVHQAMKLKFSTERGELTVHPYYGVQFPIGRKIGPVSFNEFILGAHATILSDNRVTRIKRLSILHRGDTVSIGAELELKQTTDVLTTEFALRSF